MPRSLAQVLGEDAKAFDQGAEEVVPGDDRVDLAAGGR